jgi:Flp pilus assembly protein TadG
MSAQKSGKKVVNKNVAVALGIIILVLLVGLVGAMLNYTSIINGKNSSISSLNSQISNLTSQKNQLETWLQGNNSIANLATSKLWANSNISIPGNGENVSNYKANYAGYVSVQVTGNAPTICCLYAKVTYSSHGLIYEGGPIYYGNETQGTALFPVLPASIQITVHNTGTTVADVEVIIMYYY